MATIDVKCRFCNQTDDVKKHGTGYGIIKNIDANLAEKLFRLTISINADVRAFKNFLPVV